MQKTEGSFTMENMQTVPLIVYGTLMTGECNHHYCRHAVRIIPCSIRGTLYDTGFGYPAFVTEGSGTVNAEFMEIPADDWQAVDELEEYPVVYDRQLFSATCSDGSTISGWIYIMNKLPSHAKVIPGGDWKKYNSGLIPSSI